MTNSTPWKHSIRSRTGKELLCDWLHKWHEIGTIFLQTAERKEKRMQVVVFVLIIFTYLTFTYLWKRKMRFILCLLVVSFIYFKKYIYIENLIVNTIGCNITSSPFVYKGLCMFFFCIRHICFLLWQMCQQKAQMIINHLQPKPGLCDRPV